MEQLSRRIFMRLKRLNDNNLCESEWGKHFHMTVHDLPRLCAQTRRCSRTTFRHVFVRTV
jgi:hypothetical protein